MSAIKGEVSVDLPSDVSPKTATSNSPNSKINDKPIKPAVNNVPKDLGAIETSSTSTSRMKKTPHDFVFGKVIGEGSFSTVYLARDIHTKKEYAIKVCEKKHIIREKKQTYIKREKEVLNILNNHPSPFFVQLYCSFQDAGRLYFVLTYGSCGELLPYINKVGCFDDSCTRFYSGEIVAALEHLHRLKIIHRDLKPENILLNERMHILITDFGSAKILEEGDTKPGESSGPLRKNSFVGTAQYVSPELLTDKNASRSSSDLWALGCIIFQMISGLPPFRAPNEYLIFQKILKLEYEFPAGFNSHARDLIRRLLVIDPNQRIGMQDENCNYRSIKSHLFYNGLDWTDIHTQTPPTIYPYLPGTPGNEELRSHYRVPNALEAGLDDKSMTRLLGLDLHEEADGEKFEEKLKIQKESCPYHKFVSGNCILKQGLVDKRKGLFSKRRMLLLTTGPHLYYVDPAAMVLKGEIPWSNQLRPESKNFKTFFVHTPNRTYYLEDPEGYALEWCRLIEEVRTHYLGSRS
ncbi:hypothetical protein CHUAL_011858 [Chamberlinius hualienensis]